MDGHSEGREGGVDAVRGPPPAVPEAGPGQRLLRVLRVAHSERGGDQPEAAHRLDQELVQLAGALAVPPVADPHHVAPARHTPQWGEGARVLGRVPGPGALSPAALEIEVPYHSTEGEHAVVVAEVVAGHHLR